MYFRTVSTAQSKLPPSCLARRVSCLESCLERQETGLARVLSYKMGKKMQAVDVTNLREVMLGSEVLV